MKDHQLRRAFEKLKWKLDKIEEATTEVCTYCKKLVPKGKRWETGEEIKPQFPYLTSIREEPCYACEQCLKEFERKGVAARKGFNNKWSEENKENIELKNRSQNKE